MADEAIGPECCEGGQADDGIGNGAPRAGGRMSVVLAAWLDEALEQATARAGGRMSIALVVWRMKRSNTRRRARVGG